MTKDDALKLALEALEKVSTRSVIMGSTGDYREGQLDALSLVSQDVAPALTAIKEALAQPAQDKLEDDDALTIAYQSGYYDGKKAAQPAQEPDLDFYTDAVAVLTEEGWIWDGDQWQRPPQPAQEPVAYLCGPDENGLFGLPTEDKACKDCFPVYTAPPQRTWVEPTEGEWFKCWLILQAVDETEAEFDFADFLIIAQAVLANLKEKNT